MKSKKDKSEIKSKVSKHLNEDIKESKKSISEDRKLNKIMKSNKK